MNMPLNTLPTNLEVFISLRSPKILMYWQRFNFMNNSTLDNLNIGVTLGFLGCFSNFPGTNAQVQVGTLSEADISQCKDIVMTNLKASNSAWNTRGLKNLLKKRPSDDGSQKRNANAI